MCENRHSYPWNCDTMVAEGVETKEEFDWLVEAGADFFQGYYLHRPEQDKSEENYLETSK